MPRRGVSDNNLFVFMHTVALSHLLLLYALCVFPPLCCVLSRRLKTPNTTS